MAMEPDSCHRTNVVPLHDRGDPALTTFSTHNQVIDMNIFNGKRSAISHSHKSASGTTPWPPRPGQERRVLATLHEWSRVASNRVLGTMVIGDGCLDNGATLNHGDGSSL